MIRQPIMGEATTIASHFLNQLIDHNLMPQLHQLIHNQFMRDKISTQGVRQAAKLIFPKIVSEIQAQQNGYADSLTVFNQSHINPTKVIKKSFRRSCDDMKQLHENETYSSKKQQTPWLQNYQHKKRQISHLSKITNSQSQPTQQKNKNNNIFHNRIKTINTTKHDRNMSQQNINTVKKICDLVKLEETVEKEDENIVRKREKLMRKKQLDKEFENNFSTQMLSGTLFSTTTPMLSQLSSTSTPLSYKNSTNSKPNPQYPVSRPSLSFTTDYNGQIIEFEQNNKQKKSAFRKHTILTKKSDYNKKYSTATNSPVKLLVKQPQPITRVEIKPKTNKNQNEQPLREHSKIRFKVKKQNYIELPTVMQQKSIQFEVIKQKQKQRQSSDQNDSTNNNNSNNNKKLENDRSEMRSSRYLGQIIDQNVILKGMQLSPGVTVQNFCNYLYSKQKQQNSNKQNLRVSVRIMTSKSIGRSMKNLLSQTCMPTLKSIMMSRKTIKENNLQVVVRRQKLLQREFSIAHSVHFQV